MRALDPVKQGKPRDAGTDHGTKRGNAGAGGNKHRRAAGGLEGEIPIRLRDFEAGANGRRTQGRREFSAANFANAKSNLRVLRCRYRGVVPIQALIINSDTLAGFDDIGWGLADLDLKCFLSKPFSIDQFC